MHRWFGWPGILLTSPVPILIALLAIGFPHRYCPRASVDAVSVALAVFALCFAGLGISLYPLMVPPDITIWQAAAPRASQLFVLVGASVLIPPILVYSGFIYWVVPWKGPGGCALSLIART